jgi:hypothetical protein
VTDDARSAATGAVTLLAYAGIVALGATAAIRRDVD